MVDEDMGGGARIGQREQNLSEQELDALRENTRLDVVDVSRDWEGRGFDITGHRYWFNHPWASTDVILSIRSDLPPSERGLAPTDQNLLWSIPADYPQRLRDTLLGDDLRLRLRND